MYKIVLKTGEVIETEYFEVERGIWRCGFSPRSHLDSWCRRIVELKEIREIKLPGDE